VQARIVARNALSFFEMSKDKLSTAISSNHQHVGAVLIDWTNSYHFRTTQIKGSTPFPFQTSFLSFPIFLSFLSDPTLVLSSSLSFIVPSSYFYLKGHLFSVLVVGTSPLPAPLSLDSAHHMSYRNVSTRLYSSPTKLTCMTSSIKHGHIKLSVIGLKVDTQDTKMLYVCTTTIITTTIKNILPLLWGNKLAVHFPTSCLQEARRYS
jgi:hypothetical protein